MVWTDRPYPEELPVDPTDAAATRPSGHARSRRTQAEVRALLLRTARQRFASHGYGGTATRVVAHDAGVSERLIFRYFGNKAGLFEAAVLEPFGQFIAAYIAQWNQRRQPSQSLIEETRAYVAGMYDLFAQHGDLVRALATAGALDADASDTRVASAFGQLLRPIEELISAEVARRGLTRFDSPLQARIMLSVVMALAAFHTLLYDSQTPRPSREHIIDQIAIVLTSGYPGFR